MEPDFQLIGLVIQYRSVIQFLAVVNILSGVGTFIVEALRVTTIRFDALNLVASGAWVGLAWIITGIFACLASKQATQYSRLRGYSVIFIILGSISAFICLFLVIHISYFSPFLMREITGEEIRLIVILRSVVLILSVMNLFSNCCEVAFGICQFRSGYFRFIKQWMQQPPEEVYAFYREPSELVRRRRDSGKLQPKKAPLAQMDSSADMPPPRRSSGAKNKPTTASRGYHAAVRKSISAPPIGPAHA